MSLATSSIHSWVWTLLAQNQPLHLQCTLSCGHWGHRPSSICYQKVSSLGWDSHRVPLQPPKHRAGKTLVPARVLCDRTNFIISWRSLSFPWGGYSHHHWSSFQTSQSCYYLYLLILLPSFNAGNELSNPVASVTTLLNLFYSPCHHLGSGTLSLAKTIMNDLPPRLHTPIHIIPAKVT